MKRLFFLMAMVATVFLFGTAVADDVENPKCEAVYSATIYPSGAVILRQVPLPVEFCKAVPRGELVVETEFKFVRQTEDGTVLKMWSLKSDEHEVVVKGGEIYTIAWRELGFTD